MPGTAFMNNPETGEMRCRICGSTYHVCAGSSESQTGAGQCPSGCVPVDDEFGLKIREEELGQCEE